MQNQIERDLKASLLAGDKLKTEVLRGIKNAILYEIVAQNARETGLSDEDIQKVLARESKKRAEAAQIYQSANEDARASSELFEKEIIDGYLPKPASFEEISQAINQEIQNISNPTMADMGKVIGVVKGRFGASADGGVIAKMVKEALSK